MVLRKHQQKFIALHCLQTKPLQTATGVHSTVVFSSRLNYFSLLGVNIFYMGMISLPNGVVNSLDGLVFSRVGNLK